jgi:hypothetical protein
MGLNHSGATPEDVPFEHIHVPFFAPDVALMLAHTEAGFIANELTQGIKELSEFSDGRRQDE